MAYNLFGGCSWYALIVNPADVHDVSQLIGPCTSPGNAYSCCDGTTVCGDGFHTVIYWNDFGSNARVQEARRAATPKFFGSAQSRQSLQARGRSRDLFLAPSQCLMVSYACRLLSLCCSKIQKQTLYSQLIEMHESDITMRQSPMQSDGRIWLCIEQGKASLWGLGIKHRPRCEELLGLAVGSFGIVWIWFTNEMC